MTHGFICGLGCNDGNGCSADNCTQGACSFDALPDGEACSLGSSSGFCLGGVCDDNPCASIDCDDGNQCTIDATCNPSTARCEGVLGECMSAVCVGLCEDSATRCDDVNACTADSCDPETGCVNTNLCNDSNPCTDIPSNVFIGVCQNGVCVSDIIIAPPILP